MSFHLPYHAGDLVQLLTPTKSGKRKSTAWITNIDNEKREVTVTSTRQSVTSNQSKPPSINLSMILAARPPV